MVAVHFTTIPCEPNRAISTHRKPYFGEIHPCSNKIVYTRFEVFRPFLCVFMSGYRIFVRYELLVNVPVAIFFGTVDFINYSVVMFKSLLCCFPADVNECRENPKLCPFVCKNFIGGYRCRCPPGFRGNGRVCEGKLNDMQCICNF